MRQNNSYFGHALTVAAVVALACAYQGDVVHAEQGPVAELSRLEGSWSAMDGLLRERLTFTRGGDERTVQLVLAPVEPPPWLVDSLQQEEDLLGGGTLRLGTREADFWLATRQGRHVLLIVPPGRRSALEMYLQWVPSVHAAEDLLFLGGSAPADPYFPYERTLVAEGLSAPTRSALRDTLAGGPNADDAMQRLADRPDWPSAVEYLQLDVQTMPTGRLNNPCLALHQIVEARLDDARLDVVALSHAVEGASSSGGRSKCARVLATAADRPELFHGAMTEALRALIRRLTSQHSLEVEPAVTALQRLTGESFGRDPEAWARWFAANRGEPLDFEGAVKQRIYRLEIGASPDLTYEIEGVEVKSRSALEEKLAELAAQAQSENLEPSLVVFTPQKKEELPPSSLPGVSDVLALAKRAGFGEMSWAEKSVQIYPPWHPTPRP